MWPVRPVNATCRGKHLSVHPGRIADFYIPSFVAKDAIKIENNATGTNAFAPLEGVTHDVVFVVDP